MKFACVIAMILPLITVQALKLHPTAKEIGQEYIVQNTANHYVRENKIKSDIDLFPGNYKILNGLDAKHDPYMKTGKRDPRYKEPYYPYYNPDLHSAPAALSPRSFNVPKQRYTNNLYALDKDPYYGPPDEFRVFNSPDITINLTPIKMADLTDAVASNAQIQELQKELKALKSSVEGPKFLYDQTSKVYALDPKAYYDPTIEDKQKRITYLEAKINDLNEQMKRNFEAVKVGVGKRKMVVQNFRNKNKELNNKFVADSYYYQVGNSPPPHKEKDPSFGVKQAHRTQPIIHNNSNNDNLHYRTVFTESKDNPSVFYDNKTDIAKINHDNKSKLEKQFSHFKRPSIIANIKEKNDDLYKTSGVKVEAREK